MSTQPTLKSMLAAIGACDDAKDLEEHVLSQADAWLNLPPAEKIKIATALLFPRFEGRGVEFIQEKELKARFKDHEFSRVVDMASNGPSRDIDLALTSLERLVREIEPHASDRRIVASEPPHSTIERGNNERLGRVLGAIASKQGDFSRL